MNVFKERLDNHSTLEGLLPYTRARRFSTKITSNQPKDFLGLMSMAENKGIGKVYVPWQSYFKELLESYLSCSKATDKHLLSHNNFYDNYSEAKHYFPCT